MAVDVFLYERMVIHLGFEATPCQDSLFQLLSKFVSGLDDNKLMIINGYAGTGKTSAISALVSTLNDFSQSCILMAPTGRAAKVLSGYTNAKALTIHKQIYRQKSLSDGFGQFVINVNQSENTFFIVDEASLISTGSSDLSLFGSGNLLDDLIKYVFSKNGNKLILIGDSAQLPPVGMDISKALDPDYLSIWGGVTYARLTNVVRQAQLSGILHNATILRKMIEEGKADFPKISTAFQGRRFAPCRYSRDHHKT